MKVILLDYVYKQGVAGEVINVADGYARNFLIPNKLAVKATAGELKRATKLREQAVAKRAALENRLSELAQEINGVELIFERRAAVTGKLFGSVTSQEIAEALLEKTGVDINRRRISQQGLREIGTHNVPVRLGSDNSPELNVVVIREGTMEEYLAGENPEHAGLTDEQIAEQENISVAAVEEGVVDAEEYVEEILEETDPGEAAEAGDENVDTENMETEVLPRAKVQEELDALADAEASDDKDEA